MVVFYRYTAVYEHKALGIFQKIPIRSGLNKRDLDITHVYLFIFQSLSPKSNIRLFKVSYFVSAYSCTNFLNNPTSLKSVNFNFSLYILYI